MAFAAFTKGYGNLREVPNLKLCPRWGQTSLTKAQTIPDPGKGRLSTW